MKPITIKIDPMYAARIREIAERTNSTPTQVVRGILGSHFHMVDQARVITKS